MNDAWEVLVEDILTTSGKYPRRAVEYPPTADMLANAQKLARALTSISLTIHKDLKLTSGYRPPAENKKAGGAPGSWHLKCAAADVSDPTLFLAKWVRGEEKFLGHLGLWMEDPDYTPGWVHFQIFPPASMSRFFKPHSGPPPGKKK